MMGCEETRLGASQRLRDAFVLSKAKGVSMDGDWGGLPPGWQDWVAVIGYVGFMLFVIWQVIQRSDRRS